MKEKWRVIPGFSNYNVSNFGRVKRVWNRTHTRKKNGFLKYGRRGNKKARFYFQVTLHQNGIVKQMAIHQLVAAAFIGSCPIGYQVNHKDGDKLNNIVSNLEYVTPSQNITHAIKLGLRDKHLQGIYEQTDRRTF